MIKKIAKLKYWGIFSDWNWPNSGLPEFKQFNVIYGWNGSGKSTLAKLFRTFETNSGTDLYPNCSFQIEATEAIYSLENFQNFSHRIKVFNQDFIKENIFWDECKASPILGVGKDVEEFRDKLRLETESFENAEKLAIEKRTLKAANQKSFDTLLSSRALSLKNLIGYVNVEGFYNTYDARKLRTELESFNKALHVPLATDKLEECRSIAQSQVKEKVSKISYAFKRQGGTEYRISNTEVEVTNQLFEKTVHVRVIERLKSNADLNNWVRAGKDLHEKHQYNQECQFCGATFSERFWDDINQHFSKEYEMFQRECDISLQKFKVNKVLINFPFKSEIYLDLAEEFGAHLHNAEKAQRDFNEMIDKITDSLGARKSAPLGNLEFRISRDRVFEFYQKMEVAFDSLNRIIEIHNARTDNFSDEIKRAKKAIELNNVSEIYDEYLELKGSLEKYETEYGVSGTETVRMRKIRENISFYQDKIADYSINLESFNNLLVKFLGRAEIKLESIQEGDSSQYQIKHHDRVAKHLSEGERTAIAFIYFITKLKEANFDLRESIIVVDDPVSSLDSNFMFNAFAFLKEEVKLAKQIFIFTHNFNFLRLVLRWFDTMNETVERKNKELSEGETPRPLRAGYYMLANVSDVQSKRTSQIQTLDPFLFKHHSEYEFLYKELRRFQALKVKSTEEFYNVPNMARKLLEVFMQFKHPGKLELKDRLSKEEDLDPIVVDRVFSFVNFYSHGQNDYNSTVDLTLLNETPAVIAEIFELLRIVDGAHVERMDKLVYKHFPQYKVAR